MQNKNSKSQEIINKITGRVARKANVKTPPKPKGEMLQKIVGGTPICPNCENTQFRTIVKNSSWKCQHCHQVVVAELMTENKVRL